MGAFYDEIPSEDLVKWILDQKIFFVASAPLSGHGHVNTSPKGRDTFNLVGKNACWYTDMTGSGSETVSHLYEQGNGRITIMFLAFDGPPRIVRFFGKGKVFERGSPEFNELLPEGDERILPGTRAIIWVDIHKVGTSCGYSVPYFDYSGERLILDEFFAKLEDSEPDASGIPVKVKDYWHLKNSLSIDSMPGLKCTDPSKSIESPFKLPPASQTPDMELNQETTMTKGQRAQGDLLALAQWQVTALVFAAFIMGAVAAVGGVQIYTLYSERHIRL